MVALVRRIDVSLDRVCGSIAKSRPAAVHICPAAVGVLHTMA